MGIRVAIAGALTNHYLTPESALLHLMKTVEASDQGGYSLSQSNTVYTKWSGQIVLKADDTSAPTGCYRVIQEITPAPGLRVLTTKVLLPLVVGRYLPIQS